MQNNIRFLEISVENYYIERDAKSRQLGIEADGKFF